MKKNYLPISIILLVMVIAGYFVWTTYYSTVEPVYIVPVFFVFLIASLVFLVMWIKQNTSARIFAHGTNTVIMVIALIGILALVNYISSKHSYRKDFTLNKTFSLSDQTEKILKGLNQNIMIYAFYQDGDNSSREQFKDLMEEYMHLSSKVNYKMIDPVKNPNKAIEYGVKQLNTVILEVSPDKREKVNEKVSEQVLTNAILKLTKSGSNKVVYFLKGHTKGNADDFSAVKDALKKETYEVKDLMLLQ
ncbi:MAG: Gldg family protein, partial [Candidatus Eremiobacterota bacterium]